MRKKISFLFLLVLILPMFFSVGAVFAATDIALNSNDSKAMTSVIIEANKKLSATSTTDISVTALKPNVDQTTSKKLITISNNKLTFDEKVFENATEKSRKEVMKAYVKALQTSTVSPQGQQDVIDGMAARSPDVNRLLIPLVMDSTSADLFTAMRWVEPFLPIVRLVFGIGAIVITLSLVGSTIIDLCFIGLPFAREALQNRGDKGGGNGKVPFVTSDAQSVIKETESSLDSSGGYKNAYLIYFKRRALTYILLSFCLLYLVVGELGGLIASLLTLGDGVIGGQ